MSTKEICEYVYKLLSLFVSWPVTLIFLVVILYFPLSNLLMSLSGALDRLKKVKDIMEFENARKERAIQKITQTEEEFSSMDEDLDETAKEYLDILTESNITNVGADDSGSNNDIR